MDPRRPRRWTWRACFAIVHTVTVIGLLALIAFPERHSFMTLMDLNRVKARFPYPVNHHRDPDLVWLQGAEPGDGTCRHVSVLLGDLLR